MKSLNYVILIGHLAADTELRQTKKGQTMANFPIAINRMMKTEEGKQEVADFHRVVVWGKLAEISEKYLVKGTAVCIVGRLINRSFEDKEGVKQFRTEIFADDLRILTWKKVAGLKQGVSVESIDGKDENLEG